MILTAIKEKLLEFLSKIRGFILNLLPPLPDFGLLKQLRFSEILAAIPSVFANLRPEKKRLVFFGFGGFGLFIILLLIISLATGSGRTDSINPLIAGPLIPQEELFYPDEPDFVPQFLLEREPRQSWTIEDIRPYWQRPENPDFWRGEISSAIDLLMEGVP